MLNQLHVVASTAVSSGGEGLAALRYAQALSSVSCTVYAVLIPLFLLKDSTLLGTFKLYGFMALLLLSAVISLSKSLIFLIPMTFVIILVLKEVSIKSIAMIAAVSVFVFILVQPVILLARTFKAVSDQEVSSSMVKEVYSLSSQKDLSEIIAVSCVFASCEL